MTNGSGVPSPGLRAGFTRTARLVRLRRMMVPVIAVLALWAAVPAVASARVGWRLSGTPLTESVAMEWKGSLKVEDTKTVGGILGVECSDTATGFVGVGGAGEVTKLTTTSCAGLESCKKTGESIAITPLNLPWHTELATVGGALHDVLVSGGKGTPGFKVECKVVGLKVEDECSGTLSATLTNGESGVTAAFNKSEKLTCAFGGSGSGFAEGSQSIVASSGAKLSTENEEPPVWRAGPGNPLTEAKPISWKGTVALSNWGPSGSVGVKCEDTGSGFAGAKYAGEATKWTMSNCAPVSGAKCEAGGSSTLEALHLSWRSELFTSEGVVRDVFVGTGKGIPGFKLKCKVSGVNITEECLVVPATTMTNVGNGVTAKFSNKEKFTCVGGHASAGELEGSQEITLNTGEVLHVS
jgi:hypothetical protein